LQPRVKFVECDFFRDPLPADGDLYLLKHILHDWNDEKAGEILRNLRKAMPPLARLLVVDSVVASGTLLTQSRRCGVDDESIDVVGRRGGFASAGETVGMLGSVAKLLDLNMMVMCDGKERTAEEWAALLRANGFRLVRIHRTPAAPYIEAVPV
jgi:hypothetical protein